MIVGLSLFISIGHSYASMSFSNTVNFSSYVKKGNEQIELPYLELRRNGNIVLKGCLPLMTIRIT